jgi:hypothetical protein
LFVVVGHINLFSRAMYSAQVGHHTPVEGVLMHTLCSYCFVLENGENGKGTARYYLPAVGDPMVY